MITKYKTQKNKILMLEKKDFYKLFNTTKENIIDTKSLECVELFGEKYSVNIVDDFVILTYAK